MSTVLRARLGANCVLTVQGHECQESVIPRERSINRATKVSYASGKRRRVRSALLDFQSCSKKNNTCFSWSLHTSMTSIRSTPDERAVGMSHQKDMVLVLEVVH